MSRKALLARVDTGRPQLLQLVADEHQRSISRRVAGQDGERVHRVAPSGDDDRDPRLAARQRLAPGQAAGRPTSEDLPAPLEPDTATSGASTSRATSRFTTRSRPWNSSASVDW